MKQINGVGQPNTSPLQNTKELMTTPQQRPQETSCANSICGSVSKTYKFVMALLFLLMPVIALTNIIFDIVYIKTYQQILKHTDLFTIYLLCFYATPVIAEICILVALIKYQTSQHWLLVILISPIAAWLDLYVCVSKKEMNQRFGTVVLPLQYFQCVVSVVQFLIQFYVIGYTNGWNVFLVVKVGMLIWQIINRIQDCYEHGCCCTIQQKNQKNLQDRIREDLACLGDKLSWLI